jgi:predicted Fe-Mo cluster-binding NifX family protein
MKIAVSAVGPGLDSDVDPRFGRCAYFIIVDSETMEWEGLENRDAAMPSGAGIGAARFVAQKGARAVITGVVGPKASQTLSAAGIQVYTVAGGPVREAVEAFRSGSLQAGRESVASPPEGSGQGQGRGMGMGRGQGRGQGRGMGRGMGGGMGRGMGGGRRNG